MSFSSTTTSTFIFEEHLTAHWGIHKNGLRLRTTPKVYRQNFPGKGDEPWLIAYQHLEDFYWGAALLSSTVFYGLSYTAKTTLPADLSAVTIKKTKGNWLEQPAIVPRLKILYQRLFGCPEHNSG